MESAGWPACVSWGIVRRGHRKWTVYTSQGGRRERTSPGDKSREARATRKLDPVSLGQSLRVWRSGHNWGACCRRCWHFSYRTQRACEPVWPSGKALGWWAEGPRFESASALLSLQKLWSVDAVLWLCPSQLWNIKMALIAAHLNAGIILVMTV